MLAISTRRQPQLSLHAAPAFRIGGYVLCLFATVLLGCSEAVAVDTEWDAIGPPEDSSCMVYSPEKLGFGIGSDGQLRIMFGVGMGEFPKASMISPVDAAVVVAPAGTPVALSLFSFGLEAGGAESQLYLSSDADTPALNRIKGEIANGAMLTVSVGRGKQATNKHYSLLGSREALNRLDECFEVSYAKPGETTDEVDEADGGRDLRTCPITNLTYASSWRESEHYIDALATSHDGSVVLFITRINVYPDISVRKFPILWDGIKWGIASLNKEDQRSFFDSFEIVAFKDAPNLHELPQAAYIEYRDPETDAKNEIRPVACGIADAPISSANEIVMRFLGGQKTDVAGDETQSACCGTDRRGCINVEYELSIVSEALRDDRHQLASTQALLNRLGAYDGANDGLWSSETESSLRCKLQTYTAIYGKGSEAGIYDTDDVPSFIGWIRALLGAIETGSELPD